MTPRNFLIAAAVTLAAGAACAQTAKPEPDYTLAWNIGAVTDYRYRGISQTRLQPALQGGVDFTHKSGFYAGAWASTIKWIKDAGGSDDVEVDVYGGYKFEAGPVGMDVGVLTYTYPGNDLHPSADTQELYVAGTWGPATLKYSHAVSNLFGFADSSGSGYLELSGNFDLGNGWSVTPHVGHQSVHHNSAFAYTDYSVTVGKDLGHGVTASLMAVGTSTKNYVGPAPSFRNLGRAGLVAGVKYTF
ncbi:MAG TPA: TorF family putative porin [Ramlibacter sp.]|uniref:TorF family putative porin n=1 Tax=Ramlibacter sp. TaxID=1917967 RepID=UPI002B6C50BF|nr:TorF family putative porin [Ramlibacter sp.]HVZ43390.1 TorF family putative porin [Ramlibacter sp.]